MAVVEIPVLAYFKSFMVHCSLKSLYKYSIAFNLTTFEDRGSIDGFHLAFPTV